jgi:hypothetical protein
MLQGNKFRYSVPSSLRCEINNIGSKNKEEEKKREREKKELRET